jgi:hypothetical protein
MFPTAFPAKQVLKYDDKNNKVEFDLNNKSNRIDRKETFKYDGKGNVDVHSVYNVEQFKKALREYKPVKPLFKKSFVKKAGLSSFLAINFFKLIHH